MLGHLTGISGQIRQTVEQSTIADKSTSRLSSICKDGNFKGKPTLVVATMQSGLPLVQYAKTGISFDQQSAAHLSAVKFRQTLNT
jgi:hypothetical protein